MNDETRGFSRRGALLAAAGAAALPLLGGIRPAAAAAPLVGPTAPVFHRFKVGGFDVTSLNDGTVTREGPHPIFGQDQPAEAVEKLAVENFLPPKQMINGYTPILVNTGSQLVLFDGGRSTSSGGLLAAIKAAGYSAEQIDVVVITHSHPDHIGGLVTGGTPNYPNARYVIGRVEYDFWSPKEMAEGRLARVGKLVQSNVVPLAPKMSFIEPDGEVVPGIRAVNAFGHTPGHMAYHIESEGRRLLLWADTCNHFVASLQRPEWHVRFDMDKEAAGQTRRKILGMAAADRIPVTGYHMPFPSVGYIEAVGDSFRWVPVSYQLYL